MNTSTLVLAALALGIVSIVATLIGAVRAILSTGQGKKLKLSIDGVDYTIEDFHGTPEEIAEIENLLRKMKSPSSDQNVPPSPNKPPRKNEPQGGS